MISKSFLGLISGLNEGLGAGGTSFGGQVENRRSLPVTFPSLSSGSGEAPKVSPLPPGQEGGHRLEGALPRPQGLAAVFPSASCSGWLGALLPA